MTTSLSSIVHFGDRHDFGEQSYVLVLTQHELVEVYLKRKQVRGVSAMDNTI